LGCPPGQSLAVQFGYTFTPEQLPPDAPLLEELDEELLEELELLEFEELLDELLELDELELLELELEEELLELEDELELLELELLELELLDVVEPLPPPWATQVKTVPVELSPLP